MWMEGEGCEKGIRERERERERKSERELHTVICSSIAGIIDWATLLESKWKSEIGECHDDTRRRVN